VPNGVGSGSPPANERWFGALWQVLQSPSAASVAPRCTISGGNIFAAGGSIGASAGSQATAKPTAETTAQPTTTLAAIAPVRIASVLAARLDAH
jgi:hypothetical protein